MRKLKLSKSGLNKLRSHSRELKPVDIDGPIKSIPPGEWCLVSTDKQNFISFLNSGVEDKFTCLHILDEVNFETSAEDYIKTKIAKAVGLRKKFVGYENGSRLFYGSSDGLPGLIIDHFPEAAIIQINTAGVDRYRELIGKEVESLMKVKSYFLDNPKYREKEVLPVFHNEPVPDLKVSENGFTFSIRSEVMQKIGFYYDHRENRLFLKDLLKRLKLKTETGIDLFCYAGAWGLNALGGGVDRVDFVDQGDFEKDLNRTLSENGLSERGRFIRADVFKFLDETIAKNGTYDVVMCDPPAFAKNPLQKDQALDGYSKLHRKVLKITSRGGLIVFSSCTHYVSHEEFQKNIMDAAVKEGRSIQLLHAGIQGWDHPVKSQLDKANYIKSYFYLMEP